MKVRKNKKYVTARLAHNKQYIWFVAPFIAKAEKIKKNNERIQAIINKSFPELEFAYGKN